MNMRKKIARAMYRRSDERDQKLGAEPRCDFDDFHGGTWDGRAMWFDMADAALDALIEPTEGMLDAIAAYRSRRTHEQIMDDRLGWAGQHTAAILAVKDGK